MLPKSSLDDVLYPMTAEIYYADTKQDELGSMKKTWVYDRTIKCSTISQASDKTTLSPESVNVKSLFELNADAILRTNDNIQKKKNGTFYPISEILITDIKDPRGDYVWEDTLNKRVQFEVKTFVIQYGPDHNKQFYKGYLSRSKKQEEVLY
jgi:hypothetical protein